MLTLSFSLSPPHHQRIIVPLEKSIDKYKFLSIFKLRECDELDKFGGNEYLRLECKCERVALSPKQTNQWFQNACNTILNIHDLPTSHNIKNGLGMNRVLAGAILQPHPLPPHRILFTILRVHSTGAAHIVINSDNLTSLCLFSGPWISPRAHSSVNPESYNINCMCHFTSANAITFEYSNYN